MNSISKHAVMYRDDRCGNCHLIHYAEKKKMLKDEEMGLCLGCHGKADSTRSNPSRNIKSELENKKYLHGPIHDKQCVPCHDPHGSQYPNLTRKSYPGELYANYEEGLYDFCFECHDKALLAQSKTTTETGFRNSSVNLHFLHVARQVKGRTCQACHATHASSGAKLISQEGLPFGNWQIPIRYEVSETGGSCMPGCHRKMDYDREKQVDNRLRDDEKPTGEPYVDYNPGK